MNDELAQTAVDYALQGNWQDAIKTNLLILKEVSDDIDALNRLSRAYFENGENEKAKKTSLKAIKISPGNNITIRALEKYKNYSPVSGEKNAKKITGKNQVIKIIRDAATFIEEPGRTKLTTLINLGSEKTYSILNAGDEVLLTPHTHKVSVTTTSGAYIGKLTDDLSARIRRFTKGGNKYQVFIKSASKNCVKIFIKETKKGKDLINTQSFPRESLESFGEFSS